MNDGEEIAEFFSRSVVLTNKIKLRGEKNNTIAESGEGFKGSTCQV